MNEQFNLSWQNFQAMCLADKYIRRLPVTNSPYTYTGTYQQYMRAGSSQPISISTGKSTRPVIGRKRNPSSTRLKQMGPYLIPRGKGYTHGAMMDGHFRYMP